MHVSVSHGDQYAIYREIETKYSGVNNYFKAIGVELRFSNPYMSANSSLQSSSNNSDVDDSMSSSGHNNSDDDNSMLSSSRNSDEEEDMDD